MRAFTILFLVAVLALGCKKNNVDPDDTKDPNDTTGTSGQYTELKGSWEWIDKEWLHLPSDYGSVKNAFLIDGQPYAIYNVDLGAQVIQKLDYYDGTTWNNITSGGGTGDVNDFAWHQGKLYQVSSSYYGSVVMQIGNQTLVGIDTISTNSYNTYYLGSTGTSLYRLMCEPAPADSLQVERWDGANFVLVGNIAVDGITFGLPDITVEDGDGVIYITVKNVADKTIDIYSYTEGGTISKITSIDYNGKPRPRVLVHNQELYILEGSNSTNTINRYKTLKRLDETGAATTIVQINVSDLYILEAFSTPQGIIYTQGINFANIASTLTEIMLWNGSSNKRFNIYADSSSADAAGVIDLVGAGNIYNGGFYFFYNNQLHTIGNAHAGAAGNTGASATKVYFARYNEE